MRRSERKTFRKRRRRRKVLGREQWTPALYDFDKNREIVEKNSFLLEKRTGLGKMLAREAGLENHPVIKDICKKYHLDNWKHQFLIYKIFQKNHRRIGLYMYDDTT